jgi:hypothetical protein
VWYFGGRILRPGDRGAATSHLILSHPEHPALTLETDSITPTRTHDIAKQGHSIKGLTRRRDGMDDQIPLIEEGHNRGCKRRVSENVCRRACAMLLQGLHLNPASLPSLPAYQKSKALDKEFANAYGMVGRGE